MPITEADVGAVQDRLYSGYEGAEDFVARLLPMISHPSHWQWAIHGDATEYRIRAFWNLVEMGKEKLAERFALCGRGDKVVHGPGGYKIIPLRCGCRVCPRCARYRGRQFVKKVFDHLRSREHDALWHVVLTQPVEAGEALEDTRKRLAKKWKLLRQRSGGKIAAGLLVEHIKWSMRWSGWHVHFHLFVERPDAHDLVDFWRDARIAVDGREVDTHFCRLVARAGEKIVDLDPVQGELWPEASTQTGRAVQYIVRDVVEGPNPNWMNAVPENEFQQLCQTLANVKLHRMLGSWRRKAEVEDDGTNVAGQAEEAECMAAKEKEVGTVDDCFKCAFLDGCRKFLIWLFEQSGANQTEFAKRVRTVVHSSLLQGAEGLDADP